MIEYEVGARPTRAVTLVVRDELDNPVNLIGYDSLRVEMLGEDGKKMDLSGVVVEEIGQVVGGVTVTWPSDRSLFKKKGIYTLRLVLERADGARDITRTAEIKVREFGRIK